MSTPGPRPTLLFGASRGVGLEIARILRARTTRVLALVRPGSNREDLDVLSVEVVEGDALDRADVSRAVAQLPTGADIISSLGPRGPQDLRVDDVGHENVIAAALFANPRRVLFVTSIGCGEMAPFRSARVQAMLGPVLDAKTRAEEALRRSGLPFTIIRPGGLRNGPATGAAELSTAPDAHGMIRRADVAALVVSALDDDRYLGMAAAAIDPSESTSTG